MAEHKPSSRHHFRAGFEQWPHHPRQPSPIWTPCTCSPSLLWSWHSSGTAARQTKPAPPLRCPQLTGCWALHPWLLPLIPGSPAPQGSQASCATNTPLHTAASQQGPIACITHPKGGTPPSFHPHPPSPMINTPESCDCHSLRTPTASP